jgi:hypothetical protein
MVRGLLLLLCLEDLAGLSLEVTLGEASMGRAWQGEGKGRELL